MSEQKNSPETPSVVLRVWDAIRLRLSSVAGFVREKAESMFPTNLHGAKDRHIGLHGSRSTGKTCFWATCLYGKDPNLYDEIILLKGDENTLYNAWQALTEGDVPAATAVAQPDRFGFVLKSSGYHWTIRTSDYAGALVQENSTSELKNEVRRWLLESDGIMLFIDAATLGLKTEPALTGEQEAILAKEIGQRRAEISTLLGEMVKKDASDINTPIAFVVTKWDRFYDQSGVDKSTDPFKLASAPDVEQKKLKDYLESNHELKGLYLQVKQAGANVELFPVSTFGIKGTAYRGEPDPFNLHAPIEWLARKSDENYFKKADEAAQHILKRPYFSNCLKDWMALRLYRNLITKKGIDKGPVNERINERIAPLQRKCTSQFRFGSAALLIFLILSSVGMGYRSAKATFDTALGGVDSARSETDLQSVASKYNASRNPFLFLNGKGVKNKIAAKTEFLRSEKRKSQVKNYNHLKEFREKYYDPKELERRIEEYQVYLNDKVNEGAPELSDVEAWKREDERDFAPIKKEREFDAAYSEVLAKLIDPNTAVEESQSLIAEFHKKFPEKEYPKKESDYSKLQGNLGEKQKAYRDKQDKELADRVTAAFEKDRRFKNENHEEILKETQMLIEQIKQVYPDYPSLDALKEIVDSRKLILDKAAFRKAKDVWNGANFDEAIKALEPYEKSEADDIRKEAENTIAEIKKARTDKLLGELVKFLKVSENVGRYDKAEDHLKTTFPGTDYPTIKKLIAEQRGADKWKEINNLDENRDFDKIIELTKKFKDDDSIVKTPSVMKDAEDKLEKAKKGWDKYEYGKIKDAVDKARWSSESADYMRALNAAKKYLSNAAENTNPDRSFGKKATVGNWIAEFERKTNGTSTIKVVKAEVSAKSLYHSNPTIQLEVYVRSAGNLFSNKPWWSYINAKAANADPFVFNYQDSFTVATEWEKEASLVIIVREGTVFGGLAGQNVYAKEFVDPFFILSLVKKPLVFTAGNGTISVTLSCSDFAIPELKSYDQ